MAVEERTIELTAISATGLKKPKMFGRELKCYVVAHIYPEKKVVSSVDNYGGVNPTWNSILTLTCDEALLQGRSGSFITVEILSRGTFSDKVVGTTRIPLHEIMQQVQFRAVELLRPSGKVQGILNVSFRLGEKRLLGQFEDPAAPKLASYSDSHVYNQHYQQPISMYTSTSYATSSGPSGYYQSKDFSQAAGVAYLPPLAPKGSTSSADEPVMGYPAPGYLPFAPLGHVPQQQSGNVQRESPYVIQEPFYPSKKEQQRQERKARKNRRRHKNLRMGAAILGGIILGLILL